MKSTTKVSISVIVGTVAVVASIFSLAVHQQSDCDHPAKADENRCSSHGDGGSGGSKSDKISRGGFGATGEGHASFGGHGAGE